MEDQIFVGSEPTQEKMQPIKAGHPHHKPLGGGLWTSSHLGDGKSGWTEWCSGEQWFTCTEKEWNTRWLLKVTPNTKVYHIDSKEDLDTLLRDYCRRDAELYHWTSTYMAPIDFERLAEDYDGLHLTNEGQWDTRYTRPGLNGWDCESTIWFRWVFDEVEKIEANEPYYKEAR